MKENAQITGVVGNPSFAAFYTLSTSKLTMRAKSPAGYPYEAFSAITVVTKQVVQITTTEPGNPNYNVTLTCSVE